MALKSAFFTFFGGCVIIKTQKRYSADISRKTITKTTFSGGNYYEQEHFYSS